MFYLCCWGWGTAMYAYVWLNQVQSSTHTCVLVVLVVLSYFIKLQVLHFAWPAQTTLYFSILGPPIIWGGPLFADLLYFLPTEKINSGFFAYFDGLPNCIRWDGLTEFCLCEYAIFRIDHLTEFCLCKCAIFRKTRILNIWLSFAYVNVFLEKLVFSTFDWVLPI